MKRNLMIVIILFAAYALSAQNNKRFLTEDFDTFIRYVEETHPDPYSAYGGRMEFKRQAQNLRGDISSLTTRAQFIEMLSNFIALLGDGHTRLDSDGNEVTERNKFLPVTLKVAVDGIFVSGAAREYDEYTGSEVSAINDVHIDSLLTKVKRIRPVENKYGEYHELCMLLQREKGADLLFGATSRLKFTLRTAEGKPKTTEISYVDASDGGGTHSRLKLMEENNILYAQMLETTNKRNAGYFVWKEMYSREMVEEVAKNAREYLDMNLNSLYENSLRIPRPKDDDEAIRGIPPLYSTFHGLLSTMKSKQSKYLIVDLRENGGGMTPLCMPLLYMMYGDKYLNYECRAEYNRLLSPLLLKKWGFDSIEQYNELKNNDYRLGDFLFGYFFNNANSRKSIVEKRKDLSYTAYYGGIGSDYTVNMNGIPVYEPHVVVLCSPKTFSAAYHFMYLMKQIGRTTIVGVPSRQAGNSFMETTRFELPNTKIGGSISNGVQVFFPNDPYTGKVLTPDFAMHRKDYAKYDFDPNAEILYVLDLIDNDEIK